MIEDYRKRKQKYTLDGAPIFTTKKDSEKERNVADRIEKAWDCNLQHLGIYSPVDWWAVRHGQPVGWIEIKSREYDKNEHYSTILLNVRKWLSLMLLTATTDIPAIFVSNIRDQIKWIPVSLIDARNIKVIIPKGGIVKSRNDREPCILVPYEKMNILKEPTI
jgi:hypothetical protein